MVCLVECVRHRLDLVFRTKNEVCVVQRTLVSQTLVLNGDIGFLFWVSNYNDKFITFECYCRFFKWTYLAYAIKQEVICKYHYISGVVITLLLV